jgi:Autotransporter beta-domain
LRNGTEHSAARLAHQFLELMLDPFVNGRGYAPGPAGGGALGFAPDEQASLPDDVALAYASILKAPPKPAFDQRWSTWGTGFGGSNTTSGDPAVGSNNTTTGTFGFAAGADYHVSPYTVVGFALAGAGTNWGLANALGTGRSEALQAGAYGITWFGPAYLAGSLAFSNHWFTTNRSALGDQLSANFVGQSYGARTESGYRIAVLPTLGVTPYGAVQFQDFNTPAFGEVDTTGGGLGLNFAAQNSTDDRTGLALRRADACPWQAAGALRPRRLGARLCQQSGAGCCVPGAARRGFHRQRRADPARLRTDHRRRATILHGQLVGHRQVRRRVRQRLSDLRRIRNAALYVVVNGEGTWAAAFAPPHSPFAASVKQILDEPDRTGAARIRSAGAGSIRPPPRHRHIRRRDVGGAHCVDIVRPMPRQR